MNIRTSCAAALIGIISGLSGANLSAHSSRATTNESQIIDEFGERITQYLELRKKATGTPPGPTKSTQKLVDKQDETRSNLQAARARAKQGDIFTPEIAQYFRRQIAAALNGPKGGRIVASLRHAEPVQNVPLRVNDKYPEAVPLQSTPPSLLLNLPRLPQELEYRIVGRDLVLYDIAANLIVDFVPDAIPAS